MHEHRRQPGRCKVCMCAGECSCSGAADPRGADDAPYLVQIVKNLLANFVVWKRTMPEQAILLQSSPATSRKLFDVKFVAELAPYYALSGCVFSSSHQLRLEPKTFIRTSKNGSESITCRGPSNVRLSLARNVRVWPVGWQHL